MAAEILKFVDSLKAQKSKHLANEALFFLQMKKSIHYALRQGYNITKKFSCEGNL